MSLRLFWRQDVMGKSVSSKAIKLVRIPVPPLTVWPWANKLLYNRNHLRESLWRLRGLLILARHRKSPRGVNALVNVVVDIALVFKWAGVGHSLNGEVGRGWCQRQLPGFWSECPPGVDDARPWDGGNPREAALEGKEGQEACFGCFSFKRAWNPQAETPGIWNLVLSVVSWARDRAPRHV